MKRCTKCNVNIHTDRKTCPLCNEVLTKINDLNEEPVYPKYNYNDPRKSIFYRLLVFLSWSVIIVSVLTNIATLKNNNRPWSVYCVAGVIYLWILIRSTILSKNNIAMKLVVQNITSSLLVYLIDYLSGSVGWSLNYVIPALSVAATFSIVIILMIKYIKYSDYILYLVSSICLGFVPLGLYFFKLSTILWPSLASAAFSFVVILGMIVFADRETKSELKKRFHI